MRVCALQTKMYPQINVNGTGLCNCSDIVSTITLTGKDANEVTYAVIFTYTKVKGDKKRIYPCVCVRLVVLVV